MTVLGPCSGAMDTGIVRIAEFNRSLGSTMSIDLNTHTKFDSNIVYVILFYNMFWLFMPIIGKIVTLNLYFARIFLYVGQCLELRESYVLFVNVDANVRTVRKILKH
jgi:hypothetical protein